MLELSLIAVWITRKVKATICERHIMCITFVQQYAALEDPFPWAQSEEELFRSADRLSLPAWTAKNTDAPEGRLLTVLDREWFRLSAHLHNQTQFSEPHGCHDKKSHWSKRFTFSSSRDNSPFCLSHFAGTYVGSDYHKITWANDKRFGLVI